MFKLVNMAVGCNHNDDIKTITLKINEIIDKLHKLDNDIKRIDNDISIINDTIIESIKHKAS